MPPDLTPEEEAEREIARAVGWAVAAPAVAAGRCPSSGPTRLSPSIIVGEALLGLESATPQANVTNMPGHTRTRTPVAYLLPFEIVSVHLLVVLIGAAYLARAKRRRGAVP